LESTPALPAVDLPVIRDAKLSLDTTYRVKYHGLYTAFPDGSLMVTYRPAAPSDAEACIVLRGQTRENAIRPATLASYGITAKSWAENVETGRSSGIVCIDANRIVGYCFGDTHTGEILVLALLPKYEGQEIGKTLLSQVVTTLRQLGHKRLFLGCSRNPEHRSYGFYRHLGWKTKGTTDAHGDEVLELI
jgi:ribosomal protein S18 acetylase RimI-like enzyme